MITGALTRAPGETVAGSPYAITQGTLGLKANYALTYVGANLTITTASTTTTLTVSPGTVQFSDQVTLSAHVGGTVGGSPTSLAKAVTATFVTTNSNYAGSGDTDSVTETLEDVTIDYASPNFFVSSSSTPTTLSPVVAAVVRENDSHLGNQLDGLTLLFTANGTASTVTCTATLAVSSPGVANGSCTLAGLTAPNTYEMSIVLQPNGYYSGRDDQSVTTAQPGTGFTTGGGWLQEPTDGTKSNFGFNAKYLKKGISGNSLYINRRTLTAPMTVQVGSTTVTVPAGSYNWVYKSNVMDQMTSSCTTTTPKVCTARISGKVTIKADNRATGVSYGLGGGWAFQVDVTDNGEPGSSSATTADTYALRVWDASTNGTYYRIGTSASQLPIKGGNIQVRP